MSVDGNKDKSVIQISELLRVLWNGKFIILLSTLSFFIIASSYTLNSKKIYETRIDLEIKTPKPLFARSVDVARKYKSILLNNENFNQWKKTRKDSDLEADNFFIIVNRSIIMADERLMKFKKKNRQIILRSDNKNLLDDIYDYLDFTNENYHTYLHSRILNQIKLLKNNLGEYSSSTGYFYKMYDLTTLKKTYESGERYIVLKTKSFQKLVSPNNRITLWATIFGLLFGLIVVVMIYVIRDELNEKN